MAKNDRSIHREAILITVDAAIRDARTIVPGKVSKVTRETKGERDVNFDSGIGKRAGGEETADGTAPDAPVLYPGGGGFSMRWPINAGDEAVALVADRPTGRWRQNKIVGQAEAFSEHHHNFSDALVLPVRITPPEANPTNETTDWALFGPTGEAMRVAEDGPITLTKSGVPVATLTMEAGGSVTIEVVPGQSVNVGGPAAQPLALYQPLITAIDALMTALVAAGSGPTYAGAGAAQTAWNGAKSAIEAQKAKGE